MNKFKFFIKEVLFPASFFFTIFNIFVYLFEYIDTQSSTKLINFLLILLYFIIICLANKIFRTDLSMFTKVLIHYLAFLLPLMGLVVILGNNNAIAGVFIVVTVVYALIATPVLIIRSILRKKDNETTKYDSQFN